MGGGSNIGELRDRLSFGRAFAEADGRRDPRLDVAAMADSEQVCGCNGVSKGKICRTILDRKLTTLDDVRAHTKASPSCGQCTSLVQAIIAHPIAFEHAAPTQLQPPLCPSPPPAPH